MSSSYLSSIAKQILSRALFFGSVRAQKGQGAMRAAKGIFRTVDEPWGQLDARPSKNYRISWFGVCPLPNQYQNDTPIRAYTIRCRTVHSVSAMHSRPVLPKKSSIGSVLGVAALRPLSLQM